MSDNCVAVVGRQCCSISLREFTQLWHNCPHGPKDRLITDLVKSRVKLLVYCSIQKLILLFRSCLMYDSSYDLVRGHLFLLHPPFPIAETLN